MAKRKKRMSRKPPYKIAALEGINHMMIYHQAHCKKLAGGLCNCSPEWEILTDEEYNRMMTVQ